MTEKETANKSINEIDAIKPTKPDTVKTESETNISQKDAKPKKESFFRKYKKAILISLLVIFGLLLITSITIGVYTYKTVNEIKDSGNVLKAKGTQTYTLFKEQNLPGVESNLAEIETDLTNLKSLYGKLAFYKYIPGASSYYNDGMHALNAAEAGLSAGQKSIKAITPYADVLGFGGEEKFTGGTTEDRLKVILETLEKITPILDEIALDLGTLNTELSEIDPERYPEDFRDINVKEGIMTIQGLSGGAVSALTEFKPVIEQIPSVAGAGEERKKYLILFQNDNELRPTGGFLTAYAIINVENGKVEAEKSDDIYELDQKFTKKIDIPEELGRYLTTEKYWNLRDMNVSPDFKESMDKFFENYQTVNGEPDNLDGIIAIDTNFLTSLLDVLGPIEVAGYGTFSSEIDERCDCPGIIYILSEIITRPTPYLREDRKGILGPMMRSLLTKAYTAPKQDWPNLFETGFKNIQNRHVQFYFLDEEAQSAAELANVAGRMIAPTDGSDFLAIINSNLGGAKSNLFVEYDVEQTVSAPVNGMLEKTIEVTYKNTHKADNCNLEAGLLCLNSTLQDWTRIYVPKGSELVESQGFLEEAVVYDEGDFTVFDGFFTLEPLGASKLTFTYKVPYSNTQDYKLNIWKQGGVEQFENFIDVTGGQEKFMVEKDTTYETFF